MAAPTVAWGNGGIGTGAGPTVSHRLRVLPQPARQRAYRILNPVPAPAATTAGVFVPVAAPGATVADAALPAAGDARNYTVIQATRPVVDTCWQARS